MRTHRPRACHVVAALLAAMAAAGSPSAASAADLPVLAGTTTLSGQSGYVDVVLPEPVTIDIDHHVHSNTTFQIEGTGRFVGVALHELPGGSDGFLVAGRFDPAIFCSGSCVHPDDWLFATPGGTPVDDTHDRLAPGSYRLFLITDGSPARVTLRLAELPGTTELEPDHPSEPTIEVLPRRDAGVQSNLAVFGDSHPVGDSGLVFDLAVAYYMDPMSLNSAIVPCRYASAPTNPLAFYPGCPADPGKESAQHQYLYRNPDGPYGPYTAASMITTLRTEGGVEGVGGSIDAANAPTSMGWAAVWLDFGAPPAP